MSNWEQKNKQRGLERSKRNKIYSSRDHSRTITTPTPKKGGCSCGKPLGRTRTR